MMHEFQFHEGPIKTRNDYYAPDFTSVSIPWRSD